MTTKHTPDFSFTVEMSSLMSRSEWMKRFGITDSDLGVLVPVQARHVGASALSIYMRVCVRKLTDASGTRSGRHVQLGRIQVPPVDKLLSMMQSLPRKHFVKEVGASEPIPAGSAVTRLPDGKWVRARPTLGLGGA
jgi:hypothetical protein